MRFHASHQDFHGFQKIYFSPRDRDRYWLLTLNVPKNVMFADSARALNRVLFVSLVVGLFALLLVVWFISRKILTPVVNMANAASRLQEGDLTVRVDTTSVRDEFCTLYMAINAFAKNQQHVLA